MIAGAAGVNPRAEAGLVETAGQGLAALRDACVAAVGPSGIESPVPERKYQEIREPDRRGREQEGFGRFQARG